MDVLDGLLDLLFNHPWNLVGALVIGLFITLIFTWRGKSHTWHCFRCGEEFPSEQEALGHAAVHASHKVGIKSP